MPVREYLPVKVTVIVEVDGHTLRFEETGEAAGARYNGANTDPLGWKLPAPSPVLEQRVRGVVNLCMATAHERLSVLLQRIYPLHTDSPTEETTAS